jgi:hypothetical protein
MVGGNPQGTAWSCAEDAVAQVLGITFHRLWTISPDRFFLDNGLTYPTTINLIEENIDEN